MNPAVLDNAVPRGLIAAALATWPDARWPHWHRYELHGTKFATKDADRLTPACFRLIDLLTALHPADVLGCEDGGMFPDLDLHGAGMHWIPRGGWLDRHVDGAVHPLTDWRRRANTILYLESCVGGELVIGDQRIAPQPGRVVIFETHDHAFHAVQPVTEGNRRSLSLFWWDLQPVLSNRTAAAFS